MECTLFTLVFLLRVIFLAYLFVVTSFLCHTEIASKLIELSKGLIRISLQVQLDFRLVIHVHALWEFKIALSFLASIMISFQNLMLISP